MNNIPKHIAVVMDGNGRWAENQHLMRFEGHRAGVDAVKCIIKCCIQYNVPILSLFAFSSENWSRPATEINFLMQLFLDSLKNEVNELNKHGVSIRFIGSREPLSPMLQKSMQDAEQLTASNDQLIVNIMINYGGRWDILNAVKRLAQQVKDNTISLNDIDESTFSQCLSTHNVGEPDLFIRTSGEQRLSNFYLWQLAYTELFFSEVYWPEFDQSEFEKALACYRNRQRRYGKTTEQVQEAAHV